MKLIELKGLVGTVTIIVGNFNILLSTLSEQSDRKYASVYKNSKAPSTKRI